jgi:hypothetical protein
MDKPLVVAVSRAEADVFRAWRQQAFDTALFVILSPRRRSACTAASGGGPSPAGGARAPASAST